MLLTPGIPEYLSSSSPIADIFLNPGTFALELVANLDLYGPGVLLVREAMIRWKKGWVTVLLLEAAYGILEEGVALSTLFDPKAGPVGQLGHYGHWLGVSWVWVATVIPVHMVFSVSIPILLLGLALPGTAGKSLLTGRGIVAAFGILAADVAVLFLEVLFGGHFWMGFPLLLGSFAVMGGLVLVARLAPPDRIARSLLPLRRPRTMAVVGVAFFPAVLTVSSLVEDLGAPPVLGLLLVVLLQLAFLLVVVRLGGSSRNESQLIALCFGLVLPIAAIGLIGTIKFPIVIAADIVMALFFMKLRRKYGASEPRDAPDRAGTEPAPKPLTEHEPEEG